MLTPPARTWILCWSRPFAPQIYCWQNLRLRLLDTHLASLCFVYLFFLQLSHRRQHQPADALADPSDFRGAPEQARERHGMAMELAPQMAVSLGALVGDTLQGFMEMLHGVLSCHVCMLPFRFCSVLFWLFRTLRLHCCYKSCVAHSDWRIACWQS